MNLDLIQLKSNNVCLDHIYPTSIMIQVLLAFKCTLITYKKDEMANKLQK